MLLIGLLLLVCLAGFLLAPRTTIPGAYMHCPQWAGFSYVHHWPSKSPIILPTGQSGGGIFSIEVPSSQMSILCQVDTKLGSTLQKLFLSKHRGSLHGHMTFTFCLQVKPTTCMKNGNEWFSPSSSHTPSDDGCSSLWMNAWELHITTWTLGKVRSLSSYMYFMYFEESRGTSFVGKEWGRGSIWEFYSVTTLSLLWM